MLTDLQRRVRGIIAGLPEGAAVALAGGSALIVTGVVRRGTDDLDFFAAHPQPVAPMLDALEAGLKEAGLRVTRLRAADTYARLLIESDSDATYIDLATDYRLMPALQTLRGRFSRTENWQRTRPWPSLVEPRPATTSTSRRWRSASASPNSATWPPPRTAGSLPRYWRRRWTSSTNATATHST